MPPDCSKARRGAAHLSLSSVPGVLRFVLDMDVHLIPAHGPDPAHFHYDIRYLFTVSGLPPPLPAGCSLFTLEEALAAGIDDSLARALRKAAQIIG